MVSTLDLSHSLLGLYRNGQTHLVAWESGPPPRIDGYMIGTPVMERPAPHNGEMHPDGDEVLFLISGRLDVVLEEDETQKVVEMTPGQTLIVPKESGIAFCRASPASYFTLRPDQVANGGPSRTPL